MVKLTPEQIKRQCERIIPSDFIDVMQKMGQAADAAGERCYIVGGLPRDCILDKINADLDFVCTNPVKIITHLKQRYPSLIINPEKKPTTRFESHIVYFDRMKVDIVEPRKESYIRDIEELKHVIGENARHADVIKPIIEKGDFMDDVLRRDFTVNTLYLGVGRDDWFDIVDLTGRGLDDLSTMTLDTPHDPDQTFADDPTRMLRGVRFAACKNMTMSPRVRDSIERNAHEITRVPSELIRDEIIKGGWCNNYYPLMDRLGLMRYIFPEVTALHALHQNPVGHTLDAFDHTMGVVEHLPQDAWIRLAGLLHDIGKAKVTDDAGHAYGHDEEGSIMTENILQRLRFSTKDTTYITRLVGSHMKLPNFADSKHAPSATRRFIRKYDDILPALEQIARADTLSDHPDPITALREIDDIMVEIRSVKHEMGEVAEKTFKLEKYINGHDLMAMGFKGIGIGKIKQAIEDEFVKGTLKTREDAIAFAKKHL